MDKELTRIVGLTGGMGAGKSTLVPIVEAAGIPVLDMDAMVREIYGEELFCMELDEEWGLVKGEDVKAQMAAMITQHPERLSRLEEIIGPWMESAIEDFVKKHRETAPFILMDAPLLFEAHFDELCDMTIGIQCPREIREERVMRRPGMSGEKMKILMDRQITEEVRAERASMLIDSSGSIDDTQAAMQSIVDDLKGLYGSK